MSSEGPPYVKVSNNSGKVFTVKGEAIEEGVNVIDYSLYKKFQKTFDTLDDSDNDVSVEIVEHNVAG